MKPLEAFVVEDHHEALTWIYRQIGAKRLPVAGTALLHLDSHPDLLLPAGLRAEEANSRHALLPQLSIGDWILPAVFAGHVGRVLWLRPPWARQLPEGPLHATIGHTDDGELRVDACHPYFVSELMHAPAEQLRNARPLLIDVVTLGGDTSVSAVAARLAACLGDAPFVLDIDLDFFSTRDPFLTLLPAADVHGRLRKLFAFEETEDAAATQAGRRALLAEARAAFDHLEAAGSLDGFGGAETPLLAGLRELAAAVRLHYPQEKVDWQLVYDAACTFDTTGLPHHVTPPEQVEKDVARVGELLDALPDPGAVTIARSSLDNYCPAEQVEHIQQQMLDRLRRRYPRLRVNLKYDPPEEQQQYEGGS